VTERYRLEIRLIDGEDGTELISEVASCDSLYGVLVEFGQAHGYTGERFLDRIDAIFLRGARSPKVELKEG